VEKEPTDQTPEKKKNGRPLKEIPKAVQDVIVKLIGYGDSDHNVMKITGVNAVQWRRLAKSDETFKKLLEEAIDKRNGRLSIALRKAMFFQIKKGHPWWAKLAIHNYKTLLKNPDVKAAIIIKQAENVISNEKEDEDTEEQKQIRVRRIVRNDPSNP